MAIRFIQSKSTKKRRKRQENPLLGVKKLDVIFTWYQVPNRRIDGTICSIEAYKRTQYNVKSGRKTIQNDSNCRWR